MLHEFLTVHRADLIERYESKVARRPASTRASEERQHGIPRFLDQLIKALRMEGAPERFRSQEISGPSGGGPPASSGDWHNRRTARARDAAARFSLDQVVYDYGDLFQAIMELAVDRRASISTNFEHSTGVSTTPSQRPPSSSRISTIFRLRTDA